MAVRAGQLDRRVSVHRNFPERDTSGQSIDNWEELAVVWARVEPLDGQESQGQDQRVAWAMARVTIRWTPQVLPTPLDRLIYDDREYDILSVIEEGRRASLAILARARPERTIAQGGAS